MSIVPAFFIFSWRKKSYIKICSCWFYHIWLQFPQRGLRSLFTVFVCITVVAPGYYPSAIWIFPMQNSDSVPNFSYTFLSILVYKHFLISFVFQNIFAPIITETCIVEMCIWGDGHGKGRQGERGGRKERRA